MKKFICIAISFFLVFSVNAMAYANNETGCGGGISALPHPVQKKIESIVKSTLSLHAPWTFTEEAGKMWGGWAMSSVVIPVRSDQKTEDFLVAIYSLFYNQAVFIKFNSQGKEAKWGYYDFGKPAFYDDKPLLSLKFIDENYQKVRCRIFSEIDAGNEALFFEKTPDKIYKRELDASTPYVYGGLSEVGERWGHPIMKKIVEGNFTADNAGLYISQYPAVIQKFKEVYGGKPITWPMPALAWYREDKGTMSAVFYNPTMSPKVFFSLAFGKDSGDIIGADTLCLSCGEAR